MKKLSNSLWGSINSLILLDPVFSFLITNWLSAISESDCASCVFLILVCLKLMNSQLVVSLECVKATQIFSHDHLIHTILTQAEAGAET